MANIILGTGLKLLVKVNDIDGVSMKDMDFTIEVSGGTLKPVTLLFTKDMCKPERDGADGHRVPFLTSDLGVGKVSVRVNVNLIDGDFFGGVRPEKIDLDPNIKIVM